MAILLLKLVLTPALIGVASLGARRWGPMVGGWLVSLPLTSGPVALFLAIDQGPAFGSAAAAASLAGCVAIAGFCVGYARMAPRGIAPAVAGAAAGWGAGALLADASLGLPPIAIAALVAATWAIAMVLTPVDSGDQLSTPAPRWELPLRMATGAVVVVLITGLAELLGPHVSGLLAMLPVIGTVLAVFAQLRAGAGSATRVVRGILGGLLGTAAFLGVVSAALGPLGIAGAFAAAALAIAVTQTLTIWALRARAAELASP